MGKIKAQHRCTNCGASSPRWLGRCQECGEWNTLVEELPGPSQVPVPASAVTPVALSSMTCEGAAATPTRVEEIDRVLGGGLVPGSVTLLGGEPGIGKSTLALQICASMAFFGARCLVVSGEESVEQIGRRAERLGTLSENVFLLAETDVEAVIAAIDSIEPSLVIVDSIQTMRAVGLGASAGSVTQVRECASAFVSMAKRFSVAVVMVGHVTKEGTLAGPRVLEHVVDTVLEFEGDRSSGLRFVRATKHRFGPTDEVGVLEMTGTGLESVPDASGLFLDDRRPGTAGSIVVPTLSGRRPLLVELQALVNNSGAPQPRRVAQGLDSSRMAVVLAILAKRAHVRVGADDVYASVVGGIRVTDPGADLALALAVASASFDDPLPSDLVAVGELGLGGEVRKVSSVAKRLSEAARMGFSRAIVPSGAVEAPRGLTLIPVSTLAEAIAVLDLRTRQERPGFRHRDTSNGLKAYREK